MPTGLFEDIVAAPVQKTGLFDDIVGPVKKTREQVIAEVNKAQAAKGPEESLSGLEKLGSALYFPTHVVSRMFPTTAVVDAAQGAAQLVSPQVPPEYWNQSLRAPVVSPETSRNVVEFFSPGGAAPIGSVGQGTQQFLGELVSGLTTPEGVLGLASGKVSPVLPAVNFGGPMVQQLPQSTEALMQSQSPAETTKNALNVLLSMFGPLGMARGAEKSLQPKPSGISYSEIPGPKIQDLPGQTEVLGPERQLPLNTYQAPTEVNPIGGASFIVDPAARTLAMNELTPMEQREAMRGPRAFVPREEQIRPAQEAPALIGEQPKVERPVFYTGLYQDIVEPVVPNKPPVEPSGGEVSFRASAAAEGIPNALQQAQPLPTWVREQMLLEGKNPKRPFNEIDIQNQSIREAIKNDPTLSEADKQSLLTKGDYASTIRSNQEQTPQGGYGQENGPEARGNDLQRIRESTQQTEPSGIREEGKAQGIGGGIKNAIERNREAGSGVNPVTIGKELVDRFRKREEELRGGFSLAGPRFLIDPTISGFPNSQAQLDASQIGNRVKNKIPPAEWDIYKNAGIEKFLQGKKSPEEVAKWMQENGPRVEVKSYGQQTRNSPGQVEMGNLLHELDTLGWSSSIEGLLRRNSDLRQFMLDDPEVPARVREIDNRLDSLRNEIAFAQEIQPTSAYDTVSPKNTSEHPVERVDVVVPTGKVGDNYQKFLKESGMAHSDDAVKFFERNKETGQIKWQPDMLHEQYPNTIGWAAVQYDMLPSGEKVAHVFEVQSRWGQTIHRYEKRYEIRDSQQQGKKAIYDNEEQRIVDSGLTPDEAIAWTKRHTEPNHPLLRDYNRLILKAAINQALKRGVKKIVLSDAETAMMSEGHDLSDKRNYSQQNLGKYVIQNLKGEYKAMPDGELAYKTKEAAESAAKYYEKEGDLNEAWQIHQLTEQDVRPVIDQEPGMRLNYDKILPKIMEELTGVKGERVELGEHKNVLEPGNRYIVRNERTGNAVASFATLVEAEQYAKGVSGYKIVDEGIRKNLIFKNSNGTPKTSVTGLAYDLGKVPEGKTSSLFEKDRPEQVAQRLYSVPGMFFDPQFYKDTVKNTEKLIGDAGKFLRSGEPKERMSQLLDAADNQAKISAKQVANRIRVALPNEMDRKALTFVVEANGDRARLQGFLTQVMGTPAENIVRYAVNNVTRLIPHAREASRLMEAQRQHEISNGVNTDEAPDYIKHAYETRNEDFFDPGATGKGISTSFKKQRTFATYADAIAAGYVPKNLDAAALIESRVGAGLKMVNRIKWGEALSGLKDATDNQPLTKPLVTQPKGTQVAPSGYQSREILPGVRVAVKDGYTGIFDALTGRSDVSNSWLGRTALQTEGVIKHGLLLFDSFHASRVMQKQFFLTGEVGSKKGLSLLEYDQSTLNRMVKNGEIDQKTADWANANRPQAELLLRNGLNVGRIAEALYSDIARKELKLMGIDVNVPGRFNRWVFDKMTRGAMMQSALIELERAQKNHPEWTPDQAASYAAKQINVYFGNLGRQGLFKSATKQDALRLAFLAPQWVESMVQTEARAAKQVAQIPVDLAKGKGFNVGTMAKGVGIGLISYIIATQLLNKYTTGHFTWDNEDKDHKMDAYIPDPTGKSGGFWISPLSVVAEVSHDLVRYTHSKGNVLKAAAQITENKFSPLLKAEEVLRTGKDYAGNKILGTEERLKQAGKALLPVPLPLSSVKSEQPGQGQRQLYGSLGLKVEIANKQQSDQDKLAQKKYGKDFDKLTVGQRMNLSKDVVKEQQTLQERYTIAQHSTDKEFQTLKDVQEGLSPRVQEWLKKNDGKITEYRNFETIGGRQIKLTSEEQDKLKGLMISEYDKALSRLVDRANINSTNINRYISVNLELARKRAWNEMRKEINKGARVSP